MSDVQRFEFEKPPRFKAVEYDARVVRREWLTPDTLEIGFEPVGRAMFDFNAGQYVSIVMDADEGAGLKRELRPYSMWNHPDEFEYVVTVAKIVPSGRCTAWLKDAPVGASLRFVGPLGSFVLRRPLHPHIYFVATGTGIVPFRSMLKEMRASGELRQVQTTLLFGVRTQDDLFAVDEFERYARDFPKFNFVPTLSRPKPGWSGAVGRVTAHLAEWDLPVDDMQIYFCGNGKMVTDGVELLKARGLNPRTRRVVVEKYFD
jgi:NAD(P)H-flavin reductase